MTAGTRRNGTSKVGPFSSGHRARGTRAAAWSAFSPRPGLAGNIDQESTGDPESGGGLIGWTPLPSGYVTGSTGADLQTQLSGLLTYDQGWAQYLPALNCAATPADAACVYVADFERAGNPVAATRAASAQDVARACGS